ncbi:hypothetical protein C8R43DRAFT_909965, partial [Mycena crocata]
EVVGPFPESFLARCPERDKYFDATGRLLHTKTKASIQRKLDDLLPKVTSRKDSAAQFLRACPTQDPESRPNAGELLLHDWLKTV